MEFVLVFGGGFLVAVLWMDLMFDVLAGTGSPCDALPEEALGRIATYYGRVTTEARPMNLLISGVMSLIVVILCVRVWSEPGMVDVVSLALCGVAISLALARIFPNAVRLGARADDAMTQSSLAREILADHRRCFVAMIAFAGLRWAFGG